MFESEGSFAEILILIRRSSDALIIFPKLTLLIQYYFVCLISPRNANSKASDKKSGKWTKEGRRIRSLIISSHSWWKERWYLTGRKLPLTLGTHYRCNRFLTIYATKKWDFFFTESKSFWVAVYVHECILTSKIVSDLLSLDNVNCPFNYCLLFWIFFFSEMASLLNNWKLRDCTDI